MSLRILPEDVFRRIYYWTYISDGKAESCKALSLCSRETRVRCIPLLFKASAFTLSGDRPGFMSPHIYVHIQHLSLNLQDISASEDYILNILLRPAITAFPSMTSLMQINLTNSCIGLWPPFVNGVLSAPHLAAVAFQRFTWKNQVPLEKTLVASLSLKQLSCSQKFTYIRNMRPWAGVVIHADLSRTDNSLPALSIVPRADVEVSNESRAIQSILEVQSQSLEALELPSESLPLAFISSAQFPSLNRLSLRGFPPVDPLPFISILSSSCFPSLRHVDIEVVERTDSTFFIVPPHLSDTSALLGQYPPIHSLSLTKCRHDDPFFRALPSCLHTLSILADPVASDKTLAGVNHRFDANMSPGDIVATVFMSNKFDVLTFLRLGLSSEPDYDFFASVASSCPALERLDCHAETMCAAFFNPEELSHALKPLTCLRIICLDVVWGCGVLSRLYPHRSEDEMSGLSFLKECADGLATRLPSLSRVAYSRGKRYLRHGTDRAAWHIYHVRPESWSLGSLKDVNPEVKPIYTTEQSDFSKDKTAKGWQTRWDGEILRIYPY